nr:MAG TPA: hypothetical protein [Caudoviricetes sp.]
MMKNNKTNKKHRGIKVVLIVILVALVCCYNAGSTEDPQQTVVAVENATEESKIVSEPEEEKAETEKIETETTETKHTETEIATEVITDDAYSVTPGVTYVTYEGGYDNDKELYLNLIDEGDAVRYVGFSYDEGELNPAYNVDVTLYPVDNVTWVSEDGLWVANYLMDGIFYFGQQKDYNSDFMGNFSIFGSVYSPDPAADTTSSEVLTFNSDSEMRDFLRDDSNIGKTVTFDAYVTVSKNDCMYINALWTDGSSTDCIYIENFSNASSTKIFDGDYVTFTGEFVGFNSINEPDFNAISIELLDIN